eukprot:CAMPEP_0177558408 /NCGR_PEP_ID=MMETSP0369-20130122/70245_1 /TAXON_ID=447022 ORGANISM="Scrippsiella hangoei-like, Strain SHHI-4" /NCGR_SAMPLE_ID=MMETSP0369 /ASSEMBLY_ACC=CAM_ASM_000364 /LENGTH=170 /DNA_ID=CAMNT_0019044985 /DNA_START=115 /DNA_END=625 /DNA_ORIENTATION=-
MAVYFACVPAGTCPVEAGRIVTAVFSSLTADRGAATSAAAAGPASWEQAFCQRQQQQQQELQWQLLLREQESLAASRSDPPCASGGPVAFDSDGQFAAELDNERKKKHAQHVQHPVRQQPSCGDLAAGSSASSCDVENKVAKRPAWAEKGEGDAEAGDGRDDDFGFGRLR